MAYVYACDMLVAAALFINTFPVGKQNYIFFSPLSSVRTTQQVISFGRTYIWILHKEAWEEPLQGGI